MEEYYGVNEDIQLDNSMDFACPRRLSNVLETNKYLQITSSDIGQYHDPQVIGLCV
jgi:hypothetical protein